MITGHQSTIQFCVGGLPAVTEAEFAEHEGTLTEIKRLNDGYSGKQLRFFSLGGFLSPSPDDVASSDSLSHTVVNRC